MQEIAPLTIEDRQRVFLEGISAGLNYTEASQLADVDRVTAYRWRQDPEFAKRVKEAREVSVDMLIKEAERRAMRGSDKLLEFLLCNYSPERFQRATQKIDMTANTRSEVRIVSEFDGDDLV